MTSSPPPPQTRRARLWRAADVRHVPLRAILVTVAVVVLVYMTGKVVDKLRGVILLLVVAGFIALLLNPLVVSLKRWVGRRGIAVLVVTVAAVCAFAGLAVAFGYPLVNGINHLANSLPGYVTNVEHGKNWLGKFVARHHLEQWVVKNAPKIATYGRDLAHPALSLGEGALSLVFSLFTIFVLVILLLLEGPKMRTGLLGLMTPRNARVTIRVAGEVNRSVTGFMLGNLSTSLIAGVVVFVTLLVLRVPFPVLWGLWVGLLDFLPMIGGALAGIPVVLFALTQGIPAGIVTAVVFVIYTQVENHVLNPVIMSKTVRINPLLVLVSILAGASLGSWVGGFFGGFVAALLAIPFAGAMQVIVREIWHATAPAGTSESTLTAEPSGSDEGQTVIAIVEVAESSGGNAQPDSASAPLADPEPIGPPAVTS